MQGRRLTGVVGALGMLYLGGCATTTVNFDKLPDGTPVTGQSMPVLQGGSISQPSLIHAQYAGWGLVFSSGGPAVFAASFPPHDAPSAPNAACPTTPAGTASYSDTTSITVNPSHICNAWVTITNTSGPTTMKVFDVSGNLLGTTSSHGSAPGRPGVAERLHINACDISKIELSGTNYCFDDVSIRQ